MPAISMFFGIIVYLYFFDNQKHHLPHIHAEYGETEGIFKISDGEIIEGDLPVKQRKLVSAWIEIHRDELMANWKLAVSGQPVFNIDPLK
ncbi:MAG: DUF4160 domain-containing protein [Thermotogota bacterium]